jgi:flagella synthesis protein FlgN
VVGEASDFVAGLLAERRAFNEFVELLQTEQETLQRGDVDRLVSLAQLKSDKVVTLAQIEDQRNRKLAAAGFTPDQAGMTSWLKQHAGEFPDAEKTWAELLSKARQAQMLNQSNGILIEQKLRHNQQALAILQAAANQASTYGPDGQTHASKRGGRPLGKV